MSKNCSFEIYRSLIMYHPLPNTGFQLNVDSVRYIMNLLHKYELVPTFEIRRPKDNKQAIVARQKGNQLFCHYSKHFEALELYNESICLSEQGSQELSIGFANRSAVYFELRLLQPCLDNIGYAKSSGYPENLLPKLVKREQACRALLQTANQGEPSSADYVPHGDTIKSFLSEHLELKETKEFGRHVISNERLKPGCLVAYEKPFAHMLDISLRYKFCWNCLVKVNLNLMPCSNCTRVMFCSQKCKNIAQSTYHPYECPIIDYLMEFTNHFNFLSLRKTIMSILAFGGSLQKLDSFLIAHENDNVNVFNTPPSKHNRRYKNDEQRTFHQIFSLQTNYEKFTSSQLHLIGIIAAIVYIQLVHHTPLSQQCYMNERNQNVLLVILCRFILTSYTNCHECFIDEFSAQPVLAQRVSAAYPFGALINHSCVPNIIRIPHKTDMLYIVQRVIQSGEQLFINYAYMTHYHNSLEHRQKVLKERYNFVCRCIACVQNYPVYKCLPVVYTAEFNLFIHLRDPDTVATKHDIQQIVKYLEKNDDKYPSLNIFVIQGLFLLSLWSMISKPTFSNILQK